MEYDYIVIGAGSAGLSFSALMEKRGHKVCLLEAHTSPGGCSSYFEREGFIFDAGATTLSGFKDSRPLQKLVCELDLKLDIKKIDPGIISFIGNKKIRRFSNPVDWIKELNLHFPKIEHTPLWNRLRDIEKRGWILTSSFKNIPIRSFKSIFSFLSKKLPAALKSTPELFKTVDSELKRFGITDPDYLAMIDEMLFITAQNQRMKTPLLMGAMGLCYPEDTSYAMGGMKTFIESIATKCSSINYRHEVQKIKPTENGFIVNTRQGDFTCKKLISTIPIWNHENLFDDYIGKDFFRSKNLTSPEDCWSAFMVYLTIPFDSSREGLYYQIHTSEIPNCGTKSFFVSLSHAEDTIRSHSGRQVVTISTHTKASEWLNLDKEIYQAKKKSTSAFILESLKSHFNLLDSDLQNIFTGSPKSFIKYTKRYHGLVGGIPHSTLRNPLNYVIARSPYKNFYMLGDTQLPGQGIAAVVMGAMNLVDYLEN